MSELHCNEHEREAGKINFIVLSLTRYPKINCSNHHDHLTARFSDGVMIVIMVSGLLGVP